MGYVNNATNQSLARIAPPQNAIAAIKKMTTDPKMLARFQDVLGKKAPQFLASVVSAVSTTPKLQKADPMSVMGAAMMAATLNLDINPSLGFSAIVPYERSRKDLVTGQFTKVIEGQFQIMTKGFVQLAIRSGQYRTLNAAEIYADEFDSIDIVTGEAIIHPVADGYRARGEDDKIVGYVAYIELLSGFRKTVYWSLDKIVQHAQRFSKSFDSKTGQFYKGSSWAENFEAMCRKTVLKNTLSNWGILSVDMQRAVIADQGVIADANDLDQIEYVDNPESDKAAEPEQEEQESQGAEAPKKKPVAKAAQKAQKAAEEETSPQGPEQFDDTKDASFSDNENAEMDSLWEDNPF
jgi:recombination protein RecT